jgi:hypothetical protein
VPHRLLLLLLLLTLAMPACAADEPAVRAPLGADEDRGVPAPDALPPDDLGEPERPPEDGGGPGDAEPDRDGAGRGADEDGEPEAADPPTSEVELDGHEVVLHGSDGGRRTVALIDPDRHGRVLHASVRPGEHASTTVLLLTRIQQRYELRYLVVEDDMRDPAETELYGLPWRLQVEADLVRFADVPPTPVWAPDGSAIAWLEWDGDGTRLRTVGWIDHDTGSNPSDDAHAYRVDDVPLGTQLERWDADASHPTLHGSNGEKRWRIELDLERRAVALPA